MITTSLSGWEYIDLLMFLSDYTMYSIIYRGPKKPATVKGTLQHNTISQD